jgi:hypothetical protein
MIQFNQLKPGNIVKCAVSNDAAFYRVIALDSLHLKIMLDGARQGTWYREDKIKPVKLTEGILEACGFDTKETGIMFYKIGKPYHFYEFAFQEGYLYYGTHGEEGFMRETQKPIEHLHELQNLYFALTGEELEIDTVNLTSQAVRKG